ncbi:hypothetical protein [Treponema sp.]|uniref:hypothetical protein n=1 Tax=Treponema sp. TaxID=166 RepID=UPI00388E6F93
MKHNIFLSLIIAGLFFSCSSSPERVMLVSDGSNVAYSQLEEANNSIIEGKYARTYDLLNSAYNISLSVDNTDLLCKIFLSGIVFKIAVPDFYADEDSFLKSEKEILLQNARKLAGRSQDKKVLINLCSVYEVRIQLENELKLNGKKLSSEKAGSFLSVLDNAQSYISKDPYYYAYSFRTKGDVCLAVQDYSGAQKNFEAAAKIHTKERYLVEIGLDWYCAARSYSLAGKKSEALSAIQNALKYDKDAENTPAIASDYSAYSKILLKGSPDEEEIKLSEELALWSEKILKAMAKIENKAETKTGE